VQLTRRRYIGSVKKNGLRGLTLDGGKDIVATLMAAAHQLRQDKHQDMTQKKQKLTSAS
jgi:hypothetical protein